MSRPLTPRDIAEAFEDACRPMIQALESRMNAVEYDIHELRTGRPRLYSKRARDEVLADIAKYLEHPDSIDGRKCVIPFAFGGSYHNVTVEIR